MVQPDVGVVGSIGKWMAVASMARESGIPVAALQVRDGALVLPRRPSVGLIFDTEALEHYAV